MAALFVALGGAGFAASVAMVQAPQLTTLVSGSMSPNGKLIGSLAHGTERSTGVYTLTINGNGFAFANKSFPQPRLMVSPAITIVGKTGAPPSPPSCAVASETIGSNHRATAEVDCFTYDAKAGWVPTNAGFDFQLLGPSR